MLLLCANPILRDALSELLGAEGMQITARPRPGSGPPAVVVADADAWPATWDISRLRSSYRQVPCVVLSGSPLAGDFLVSRLQRGYFMQLPARAGEILRLVGELIGG